MPRPVLHFCPLLALSRLALCGGALLFSAGCWNEVAYDTPPASETEKPSEEPAVEVPDFSAPEPIATPSPSAEPTDRYAASETPADEAPQKLLPWETSSSTDDPSPEAERLFGSANEPPKNPDTPAVLEEESDDFESFLTGAYAGVDANATDTPVTENLTENPAKKPPREKVATVGKTAEEATEEIADLPLPKTYPVEAEPATEPATEENSFESLFGSEPTGSEPREPEPREPEPTVLEIEPPPARDTEEPADAFAIEQEPERVTLPSKQPTVTESPLTRVGPTIQSLPAVSVRPGNTRHLAWLLGGKLSLAQLAGAGGATPAEVAEWTEATRRLAEQLKVAAPSSADAQASAVERVGRLLGSAAEIGKTLAEMHGPDHAALVEMALKTNALLVLHEERPDLTPAVARAVAAAANRADLPGYVWRDTVKVLERRPTVNEVYDAVTKLHADVEAHLR